MNVINVKSMSEIVNNFRVLSTEDLLARAASPHSYSGNKYFAVEGGCTDDSGLSASVEFRVLDVTAVAGTDLYRISYKGQFFEMGNGYRCLEFKLFAETPRLCLEVRLSKEQLHGLQEHYKFH